MTIKEYLKEPICPRLYQEHTFKDSAKVLDCIKIVFGKCMQKTEFIDRRSYPQLDFVLWDRLDRMILPEEAFKKYESRWPYVDQSKLQQNEKALINQLTQVFGKGHFMPS